jgi:hypothetical protein
MAERCREFVDSRLRRCPPDRTGAVPYGQAGENAMRFPHLAHRSAAVHKLHSATTAARIEFDPGKGATFSRLPALAYSSRNLSKRPGPPQTAFATGAVSRIGLGIAKVLAGAGMNLLLADYRCSRGATGSQ